MNSNDQSLPASEADVRQRRLDLAQKAFREFYAQCFWSYRQDAEITEDKIAFVIRGLRKYGGLAGYQDAAALCQETWDAEVSAMDVDPEVQREVGRINREFASQ